MSERDRREAGPDDLPPELRQVAERYAAQPVPRPTAQQTSLLLARLLAEEPVATLSTSHTRPRVGQTLRIARWRVRLLGPQFWVASVILLTLAAWATHSYYLLSGTTPLLLTVPLTGVLGVAYALRTSSRGLREVEASTPLGFAEAAAGLVLAIAGFDCALSAAATLAVCQTTAQPFLALLTVWARPAAAAHRPLAARGPALGRAGCRAGGRRALGAAGAGRQPPASQLARPADPELAPRRRGRGPPPGPGSGGVGPSSDYGAARPAPPGASRPGRHRLAPRQTAD